MRISLMSSAMLAVLAVGVANAAATASADDYQGYSGHQVPMNSSQAQQLPSYPYDPKLDPSRIRSQPPKMMDDNDVATDLGTRSGIDMMGQISDYNYEEPSLGVKLTGPKFGIDMALTQEFNHIWFVTGDVRGAFGYSDYTGSGTQNDNFEDLFDIRAMAGRDFLFHKFSLSPFLGIGYRDFYSDDRGTTSTGAQGYRRENQLFYIPLGIEPRFRATADSMIDTSLEYDYVISGEQKSTLSDANAGFPDISNSQKSGYGIRGSVMWQFTRWGFGPFFNYWHIEQSDTSCATGSTYGLCGYEPTNHTTEVGAQVRYHFF